MGGGSGGGGSSTTYTYPEWVKTYYIRANDAVYADVQVAKRDNPFHYLPVDPASFISALIKSDDWMDEQLYALDPMDLWKTVINDVPSTIFGILNRPEIQEIVKGQGSQVVRYIEEEVLPKYRRGMQSIGAVNNSSFKIGEALIWSREMESLSDKFYDKIVGTAFDSSVRMADKVSDNYFTKLEQAMQFYKMHMDVEKAIYDTQNAYQLAQTEYEQNSLLWAINLDRELVNASGAWQSTPSSTKTKSNDSNNDFQSIFGGILGIGSVVGSFF